MKKSAKLFCFIGLVLCVAAVAGMVFICNEIFPKAEPIDVPQKDDIVSVSFSFNSSEFKAVSDEKYIDVLLSGLNEAKPTRRQSFDDNPAVRPYYGVAVQTESGYSRYFIYTEYGQAYIEIPYIGIYETDNELLNIVSLYFQ